MSERSSAPWADGFPDLAGRLNQVIYVEGHLQTVVTPGAMEDDTPGVVLRLDLPDGRIALCGLHLLSLIEMLSVEAEELGYTRLGSVQVDLGEPGPPTT